MNTATWIVQGILAALFTMTGIMKMTQPVDKLAEMGLKWTKRFPLSTVRFIGVSEFLGAVGLILPWAINTIPVLTPIAACVLSLVMILAVGHHSKHKEPSFVILTLVLMVMTAFVAYGRFTSL